MKKCSLNPFVVFLILFAVVLCPSVASALDFTLKPRFQVGVMDYEFEQKPESSEEVGDRGFKLVDSMPFVGAGTTIFVNQFFLDFYVQKAFSGSDSATNILDAGKNSLGFIVDSDFERDEYSVSAGYTLGSQWALFGGYRAAESRFDNRYNYREVFSENRIFVARSEYSSSFEHDGFFFGGAYALPVLKHAVVTFNAAFAILDGKYDSRRDVNLKGVDSQGTVLLDSNGEPINTDIQLGVKNNGDTVGLSLGASWKGRIGEKAGYSLGVSGYSYDFKDKSGQEGDFIADLSESVLRFSAGLSYQF